MTARMRVILYYVDCIQNECVLRTLNRFLTLCCLLTAVEKLTGEMRASYAVFDNTFVLSKAFLVPDMTTFKL